MRPVSGGVGRMMMMMVVLGVVAVGVEGSLFHQPDWGYWTYPGEDYTLHCNHSSLPVRRNNFVRWELPSGVQLDRSEGKYQLESDVTAHVINMHLTIRDVQETDSGVYLCHVYTTSSMADKRGHVLRGLNLGGHLYRDPFDPYRLGVVVGGCAAAAFFLLLTAGCLLYKFRYRPPPKQLPDSHLNCAQAQRHMEVEQGAELSTVVGHKGEVNRSYDGRGAEVATRM